VGLKAKQCLKRNLTYDVVVQNKRSVCLLKTGVTELEFCVSKALVLKLLVPTAHLKYFFFLIFTEEKNLN